MPNVSVIVPVYNSARFLSGCVDSILSQTYTDFELILVDDGSADESGEICDRYAAADCRVVVIHQKNKGAAAARNTGLDNARGRYVSFVDSDDAVSPVFLSRLADRANEKTLPICAHCTLKSGLGEAKPMPAVSDSPIPRSEYVRLLKLGMAGFLWNALFCKSVIDRNGLRMREAPDKGDYNEDLLFCLQYVSYIDDLQYTGFADYWYNIREESLSRKSTKYYFEKYAEKYSLWRKFAEQNSQDQRASIRIIADRFLFAFLNALQNAGTVGEIRALLSSEELQDCISNADTRRENPAEIRMIREKRAAELFIFCRLSDLRRRIKK